MIELKKDVAFFQENSLFDYKFFKDSCGTISMVRYTSEFKHKKARSYLVKKLDKLLRKRCSNNDIIHTTD